MSSADAKRASIDVAVECVFCVIDRATNAAVTQTGITQPLTAHPHALFVLGWTTGLGDLHAPGLCVRHAQAQWDAVDLLCDTLGGDADERRALRLLLGYPSRPEGEPDAFYERPVAPPVLRSTARGAMSEGLQAATRPRRPRR